MFIVIPNRPCSLPSQEGLVHCHPKRALFIASQKGLIHCLPKRILFIVNPRGPCSLSSQEDLVHCHPKRALLIAIPKGSFLLSLQKNHVISHHMRALFMCSWLDRTIIHQLQYIPKKRFVEYHPKRTCWLSSQKGFIDFFPKLNF